MPHRRFMTQITANPRYLIERPRGFSNWETFRSVFFMGDTTTIRAVLMVASVLEAFGFALPYLWFAVVWLLRALGFDGWLWDHGFSLACGCDPLDRPLYAKMVLIPSWAWASLFMLHVAGVWWRFRDEKHRPAIGYIVNGYGFVLWFVMTGLESIAIKAYAPSMGMEWTVIVAAFGALLRTGDKNDRASA